MTTTTPAANPVSSSPDVVSNEATQRFATACQNISKEMMERWSAADLLALYELPLMDLLWQAQQVHRANFPANVIQCSSLLSIKTGGCSEDCSYCSQSARYDTGLQSESLLALDVVLSAARAARDSGASRFCMGAAWRGPKDKDLPTVIEMVREVKALGLETCVTLGMLKAGQAEQLKKAGLDFYNHNLDTDSDYYAELISTHSYADRLATLQAVRDAGIKICSGGIVGMGESRKNRAALIAQLANLPTQPESVPINHLQPVPGTPLADQLPLDHFEFVRTIAVARIAMPASWVRLSAGRGDMDETQQMLCFLAGANSVFYGDKLLTTSNVDMQADQQFFNRLGLQIVKQESDQYG